MEQAFTWYLNVILGRKYFIICKIKNNHINCCFVTKNEYIREYYMEIKYRKNDQTPYTGSNYFV